MFTWLWTKQFSRLNQRLQSLEVAREENLLSPDLSAQTLQVAPDFWERQHQAFSYVDKQMRKLSRRSKIWGEWRCWLFWPMRLWWWQVWQRFSLGSRYRLTAT